MRGFSCVLFPTCNPLYFEVIVMIQNGVVWHKVDYSALKKKRESICMTPLKLNSLVKAVESLIRFFGL